MRIKEVDDMPISAHLQLLINYLEVLQEGRSKPDTSGNGGYIKESVYNINEIEEVKFQINEMLRIKPKAETVEFEYSSNKKTKYFK